ncbi:hypothetical protein ElyMa_001027500 [Elysia marginata]|uniref:Uncharacterized protein n=1 Tax=Elysia marginata TaxID=1093978 RepID=A0AAV4HKP9_9GAST|nr:hypothetical protein ElyMa_001027500 [Elysia marginata]
MKFVCEGRLDGRRRKGRLPISLVTTLTTACGLSLHQIVQKSQDRAGWQQRVRSSIATANTASGDADRTAFFVDWGLLPPWAPSSDNKLVLDEKNQIP